MKNLMIFFLIFNIQCLSQKEANMDNKINVNIVGGQKINYIGGGIPVTLTVSNNTNQGISILLFYPNPNGLSFDSTSPLLKKKETLWNDSERSIPIIIPPRSSYQTTYFLNRYFEFLNEGIVSISYSLELLATIKNDKPQSSTYNGVFTIKVESENREEIKKQYNYYKNNMNSIDFRIKKEAEEALLWLNLE
ncbi:MAG: hypothetical protein ACK5IC_02950 [Moheibacter sp.]